MEREFKEFLNLWLLEESAMPMETAFILVDNFINDYIRAGKEIVAEREAEEKKRRMEEKKALAEAEKKAQPSKSTQPAVAVVPTSTTQSVLGQTTHSDASPSTTSVSLGTGLETSSTATSPENTTEIVVELPATVRDVTASVRKGKTNFRAYRASQVITTPIVIEDENSEEDDI
eukprot:TRINITY_DN5111_c0_g6_i3.p1 TRINITY_DN5111_c0_g6~~TRINITY_DN5111_c0_g6_i3.p1  ORF type:complete len:174 (+),score=54.43 TRINITY_DN5111_c0_g6_i3:168-689(+)